MSTAAAACFSCDLSPLPRVVPGSHRRGPPGPGDTEEVPGFGAGHGQPEGAVPVCLPPGGVLLFDRRLLHATTPNYMQHERLLFIVGWGYRWMRPVDGMYVEPAMASKSARTSPILAQMLGHTTSAAGLYSPTEADTPLRHWLHKLDGGGGTGEIACGGVGYEHRRYWRWEQHGLRTEYEACKEEEEEGEWEPTVTDAALQLLLGEDAYKRFTYRIHPTPVLAGEICQATYPRHPIRAMKAKLLRTPRYRSRGSFAEVSDLPLSAASRAVELHELPSLEDTAAVEQAVLGTVEMDPDLWRHSLRQIEEMQTRFAQQGYLVLENALGSTELAALTAAVLNGLGLADGSSGSTRTTEATATAATAAAGGAVACFSHLTPSLATDPAILRLLTNERVLGSVCALLDSANISCSHW